jgi:hypothetical protein
MLRWLGFRLGLPVMVIGVGSAWYYTDRAMNYVEVQARIDEVRSQCHLERTKEYVVARRRSWTRDADCYFVADAQASDPSWADAKIKRETRVVVRYVSPADNQIHTSEYRYSGTGVDEPLKAGGVINIMANKTRPEAIERL